MANSAAAADCITTVRLDDDPPYLMRGEDGKAAGFAADLVRQALQRLGCQADFRPMPFARAIKSLEHGELGLLPNIYRTEEREGFALYSRTWQQTPNVMFVRVADAERWQVKSLADFPGHKIRLGVPRGALVNAEFAALSNDQEFRSILVTEANHQSLWRMLEEKRVDAVILDRLTARWELRQLHLDHEIVEGRFVAAAKPAYFGFSRKVADPDFVRRFDNAMAQMIADGEVERILGRYGLADQVIYRQD